MTYDSGQGNIDLMEVPTTKIQSEITTQERRSIKLTPSLDLYNDGNFTGRATLQLIPPLDLRNDTERVATIRIEDRINGLNGRSTELADRITGYILKELQTRSDDKGLAYTRSAELRGYAREGTMRSIRGRIDGERVEIEIDGTFPIENEKGAIFLDGICRILAGYKRQVGPTRTNS